MSGGNATDAERIVVAFAWPIVPKGADPLFSRIGATSRLLLDQSAHGSRQARQARSPDVIRLTDIKDAAFGT